MRKILTSVFLTVLSISVTAGDSKIEFYESNWPATIDKATSEKKYIFLDCYTDWCYWCKVMDKETFMDTSVTAIINSKFIPARREMEKSEEGKALSMKYHVSGFPTYMIFDSKGILVYQIVGYRKAEEFKEELNRALSVSAPLCPGFSAQLDPGFPDFYKKSFGTGKERKKSDPAEVTAFLDKQSDLSSEVAWAVMWRFNISEKYEDWIFNNKTKLIGLYGNEEVHGKMVNIIFARVDRAAEKKDKAAYDAAIALIDQHVPEESSWLKFQLALSYYEGTKDWKGYANAVQTDINTNGYQKQSTINGCAWNIYENCSDKEVIAQAVTWMDSICSGTEEYAYEDTYAAVLYKKGDYTKAELVAVHAIDLGKEAGEDVSGTEALLANIRLKKK